jgi:hypothetical protein
MGFHWPTSFFYWRAITETASDNLWVPQAMSSFLLVSLSTPGDDTAPADKLAWLSPLSVVVVLIYFAAGHERWLAPFLAALLLYLLICFHLLRKDRSLTTSISSQLRVNPSCVVSLFSQVSTPLDLLFSFVSEREIGLHLFLIDFGD